MPKNTSRLLLTSLAVAWSFDLLFWDKPLGISFPIFVTLALAGGTFLAWREDRRPTWLALVLLIPIAFFAYMAFARRETLSLFLSIVVTLALMALLAHTWQGGRWLLYGFTDYIITYLKITGAALLGPFRINWKSLTAQNNLAEAPPVPGSNPWRRAAPVLRGLLIAVPIVAVFATLLASADQVFSQTLTDFFNLFGLEHLEEYIGRLIVILIVAFFLSGVFLHLLFHSRDERLTGLDRPWLSPFLGFIEAGIVLTSVNLLFALFVAIQFRYFFGGSANIHAAGFTYSEYARRGFGELVIVAFFSLLLFISLHSISRRSTLIERRAFSGLGLALVLLLGVMLVSAFQRLLLYEAAYGFTRLRTYTHVCIVWLAVLLLALAVLEIMRRPRFFALASLAAAVGFAATINLMNVDALIVQQNARRETASAPLDVSYLASLSEDATPALIELYTNASFPTAVRDQVGGVLACRLAMYSDQELPWQSFHLSRWNALRGLTANASLLSAYPVQQTESGDWNVTVDGESQPCFYPTRFD